MSIVDMRDAKANLSKLVDRIERGLDREIVITRNGRPAACLVPTAKSHSGKRIGLLKGKFRAPTLRQLDADGRTVMPLQATDLPKTPGPV